MDGKKTPLFITFLVTSGTYSVLQLVDSEQYVNQLCSVHGFRVTEQSKEPMKELERTQHTLFNMESQAHGESPLLRMRKVHKHS